MKKLLIPVALILLSACSSSVNKLDSVDGRQLQSVEFIAESGIKGVSIELNDEAKAKLADNLKFDAERLRSTVERALEAKGILRAQAGHNMKIVVTDIRTRSSFAAVAFGFMAGDDRVEGVVTVLDSKRAPVQSFEVAASYALGGLAGGMDESRMSWLYEEFAELVLKEISGESAE